MGSRQGGSGLSKSLILKGLQCQKALWLSKNPPDFPLPEKPELQAKFDLGTEVGKLFASKDVNPKVLARLQGLPDVVAELRTTLREVHEPAIDIGPHCTDPYECDYIPYCWRQIPEDSIFDLRGLGVNKPDDPAVEKNTFRFVRGGLVIGDLPFKSRFNNMNSKDQFAIRFHRISSFCQRRG